MQSEFIQFCIPEAQLDLSKEKNGLSGYPESPFHYNEVETILLIISPLLL